MIISALWLRTSSKFSGKKSKEPENSEMDNSLSGCGFVQNIAPLLLSRDRRLKIEQNNKQYV